MDGREFNVGDDEEQLHRLDQLYRGLKAWPDKHSRQQAIDELAETI